MQSIEKYIHVVTLVSVAVGLALIIWELQQVKTLTRAQLSSDYVTAMNEVHGSVSGENLAKALAKACTSPEDLSLEEALIVENYYYALLNLVARLALLADRDGIYAEGYWREQIGFLRPFLGSPYGRAWFLQLPGTGYPEEVIAAGKELMQTIEPNRCHSEYLKRIEASSRS